MQHHRHRRDPQVQECQLAVTFFPKEGVDITLVSCSYNGASNVSKYSGKKCNKKYSKKSTTLAEGLSKRQRLCELNFCQNLVLLLL